MSFIDGTQISSNVITPDHIAHNDLLVELNCQQILNPSKVFNALWAVIKLHHPCRGDEHDDDPELEDDPCLCKGDTEENYPCKTVLVVREALQ